MTEKKEPRPPNYITPEGAKRLQDELLGLLGPERSRVVRDVADAAAQGDRSENAEYIYGKKKLREIDRRIHFLSGRLDTAEVVRTDTREGETIFFGAYVELEDDEGVVSRVRIVGEDEIDLTKGHISWRSPFGRALLKRKPGDVVVIKRPSGDAEYSVLSVRYTL